jgi:uncharacterized CHY-type Zn-finger protein
MIVLPEIHGFLRPGEKLTKDKILVCCQCNSRRTIKSGKTVPTCSKCREQTYWYEVVVLE